MAAVDFLLFLPSSVVVAVVRARTIDPQNLGLAFLELDATFSTTPLSTARNSHPHPQPQPPMRGSAWLALCVAIVLLHGCAARSWFRSLRLLGKRPSPSPPFDPCNDGRAADELKERIAGLQSEVCILKLQLLGRRNETRALRRELAGHVKSVEQLKAHFASSLQSLRGEHQEQLKRSLEEAQGEAESEHDVDRTRLLDELTRKENVSRVLQEEVTALKAAASAADQQRAQLEAALKRLSAPTVQSSAPIPTQAGNDLIVPSTTKTTKTRKKKVNGHSILANRCCPLALTLCTRVCYFYAHIPGWTAGPVDKETAASKAFDRFQAQFGVQFCETSAGVHVSCCESKVAHLVVF